MATRPHSTSYSRIDAPTDPAVRRRKRRAIGAGLGATALIATATAAFGWGTAQPCTTRTNTQVFSRWLDYNNYFLAPNGNFEGGTSDWQLAGGSSVITGNQPYSTGAKVLRVPWLGTAESRTMCVTRGENSIRLFVRNPGVLGAILHVEANVKGSSGTVAQTSFDVNGTLLLPGWGPTMALTIPNLLGGTGTQELTLNFTTRGMPATWYIDDVYVDPFKST